MQTDLAQSVLVVLELDDLAAGSGAEAVAVGHDQSAAALDELGELRIVDLGADYRNAGTERRLLVGLALLQLLQGLTQVRQDESLRTGVGNEVDDVELIAGDDGVLCLAHLCHLGDDGADLVVLCDCLTDSGVGGVHTVDLGQLVEHMDTHLLDVGVESVVGDFVGDVAVGHEEVGLLVDLQDLKVLHCTVHHGAGVNAYHRVEELVAALDAALDERACELAGVVGHVVGCDVDGAGVRRAQTHREAVAYVEQRLGNMVAGIAEGEVAFRLCLLHQLVVGVLKQTFKVDQMLKIFQMLHLFFKFSILWSSGIMPH